MKVPIRLDMDIEGQKLRDTFMWNKTESLLSPEQVNYLMFDQYLASGKLNGLMQWKPFFKLNLSIHHSLVPKWGRLPVKQMCEKVLDTS